MSNLGRRPADKFSADAFNRAQKQIDEIMRKLAILEKRLESGEVDFT